MPDHRFLCCAATLLRARKKDKNARDQQHKNQKSSQGDVQASSTLSRGRRNRWRGGKHSRLVCYWLCAPGQSLPGVCKAPGASVGGTGDTPAIGEVAGGPCDEARDGVIPGVRLDGNGLRNVCIFIASTVVAAIVTCSGTGM